MKFSVVAERPNATTPYTASPWLRFGYRARARSQPHVQVLFIALSLPVMDVVPIAIIVFLGCIVASRIMGERALRQLTPDEKVRLLDAFSTLRMYAYLPVMFIVLAGFALPKAFPNRPPWLPFLILGACAIYVVVVHRFQVRKLATLDLPLSYRSRFLSSHYVSYVGLVILFCAIVYDTISQSR